MVSFENPWAFLFILVLPLFYIFRKLKIFKKVSFPLVFCDWKGKSFEWNGKSLKFFSFLSETLKSLSYIILVCALAEPVKITQEKVFISRGADIFFVVDTSPSMASLDISNMTRLDAAKVGIKTLVSENKGASFGLVAMASEAAVIVPPTIDHSLFFERMNSLSVGELGDGSAIGIGLSTAVYHLISSKAPKKCIVLITDGENNAGSIHPKTASHLASENDIVLYVFGIGTKGSVPIEYVDPKSGKVHSGYYNSDFDSSSLEEFALDAGGRYFGIESTSSLSDALNLISRKESVTQSFYYKTNDVKLYKYFLIAASIIFVLGFFIRQFILKEL